MLVPVLQMLGRYNAVANERLYAVCSELTDEEYRQEGVGSFKSIHKTLNHILLADRLWFDRLASPELIGTPPLHTVLYEDFGALWEARVLEDTRIEAILAGLTDGYLRGTVTYVNSAGKQYTDPIVLALQHVFNHQTHHRGQIHVMLAQYGKTVNLDMHRAINP